MAKFDLVFEGGGAKGVAFIGALGAFFEAGHEPARLVGTSAGAITATLLAAGVKPAAMEAAMTEVDAKGKPRFGTFLDPPSGTELDGYLEKWDISRFMPGSGMGPNPLEKLARNTMKNMLKSSEAAACGFSFLERGGVYAGSAFVTWLKQQLGKAGANPECTFAQLHAGRKCDLSLVATDTTAAEMLVLNHRTAPDLPVAMGVRMSMSIPFLWTEVIWEPNWGLYRGRTGDRAIAGHAIVDGGVLSNFPLHLVAEDSPRVTAVMGAEADATAAGTLGLLIDESLEVEGVDPKGRRLQLPATERVMRLYDTVTCAHDRVTMERYAEHICHLPAKHFDTLEFGATEQRVRAMVKGGRKAMEEYLAKRKLLA